MTTADIKRIARGDSDRFRVEGYLNIDKFSEYLGISLLQFPFEDDRKSGAIAKKDDKWAIFVNEIHPPLRKRFTIAHEIGHYYQYRYGSPALSEVAQRLDSEGIVTDLWIERNGDINEAETEANQIAAEILMPEDIVRSIVMNDRNGLVHKSISDMAKIFGVSETAMAFRLKNLNLYTLDMV